MEGLQSLQFLMRFLPSRPSRNRKRSNTTWLHTCDILYHMGVITKSSNPRSISSLDQDNPRPADPIPAHAHQPETRHEAQLKPECHTPSPIRMIVPQPFSPFRLEVLRRGSQSCKPCRRTTTTTTTTKNTVVVEMQSPSPNRRTAVRISRRLRPLVL
jgi:hypothetical protein